MNHAVSMTQTTYRPPSAGRVVMILLIILSLSVGVTTGILSILRTNVPSDRLVTPAAASSHSLPRSFASSAIPVPAVEPVILNPMAPQDAQQINFAVPFVSGPIPAARPFKFAGTAADHERAKTCLASALWYEAGADKEGQQAVAQVVLNRLRHPAFPKTVCGVVFQGSDRPTGCQFTFSCDGSMAARVPSGDAWQAARRIADKALGGFVFKQVGTATHYHTDWVVPYWQASLDKLAAVHTQIFYRWRGWWGMPGAFAGKYQGNEAMDARLEPLADRSLLGPLPITPLLVADVTASLAGPPKVALVVEGVPQEQLKGAVVRLADPSTNDYAIELDPKAFSGSYAVAALNLCAAKQACSVYGWTNAALIPASFPIGAAALRQVSFVYKKDKATGAEQIRWNCDQSPRANKTQCLPSAMIADASPGHEAS